jgi:hypothetical protein
VNPSHGWVALSTPTLRATPGNSGFSWTRRVGTGMGGRERGRPCGPASLHPRSPAHPVGRSWPATDSRRATLSSPRRGEERPATPSRARGPPIEFLQPLGRLFGCRGDCVFRPRRRPEGPGHSGVGEPASGRRPARRRHVEERPGPTGRPPRHPPRRSRPR